MAAFLDVNKSYSSNKDKLTVVLNRMKKEVSCCLSFVFDLHMLKPRSYNNACVLA